MTAYGYIRVSTVGQADGFGLDVQGDTVRAWAMEHLPPAEQEVFEVHSEVGVSGTLFDRPALGMVLSLLGEGDILVVPRLDRLARDLVTQELLLREIRAHDAELVSCAEGEQAWLTDDPDDPSRKFIRLVLGAAAGYERDMVKLRMSLGRKAKQAQGGYIGGEPPFGYRVEPGNGLVQDEREQKVLAAMKVLRQTEMSFQEIADYINDFARWPGRRPRRAERWTKQSVHRVLKASGQPA